MEVTSTYYTLNDFNRLLFDTEISSYNLEKSTEETIKNLISLLGFTQSETHTVIKNNTNKYNNQKRNKNIEESWLQPEFKTTVIEKKEGTINDIRACLNKLSENNYEDNKSKILKLIHDTNSENLSIIANQIFDIASTNKFYSEIYAKLYKELLNEFSIFEEILQKFVSEFTETMRNIIHVEQNQNYDNYDDFCAYNKKNDIRKATSIFIVNLVKINVLSVGILSDIITKVQIILNEFMNSTNRTNEVQEITENLYLLVNCTLNKETKKYNILKDTAEWPNILENITRISKCKANDYPSLTTRCIFKHLDILDIIQKS